MQNDILARSAEQKLGLGASGLLEGKNCLLVFMVRNIADQYSESVLWHHPFVGRRLYFIEADYGPCQSVPHTLCLLLLEERKSLGLAKSLPNLLRFKEGFKDLLMECQAHSESLQKAPEKRHLEEANLGCQRENLVGRVAKV